MKSVIEKLELALKIMQDRRHEISGLGAPIRIIKDVIEELDRQEVITAEEITPEDVKLWYQKFVGFNEQTMRDVIRATIRSNYLMKRLKWK